MSRNSKFLFLLGVAVGMLILSFTQFAFQQLTSPEVVEDESSLTDPQDLHRVTVSLTDESLPAFMLNWTKTPPSFDVIFPDAQEIEIASFDEKGTFSHVTVNTIWQGQVVYSTHVGNYYLAVFCDGEWKLASDCKTLYQEKNS